MSVPYIVYDLATGIIKRVGRALDGAGGAPTARSQAAAGEGVIVGVADPETNYVDPATKEIRARPLLALSVDRTTIAADGVDKATISGVPAGARYAVLGTPLTGQVDDGTIEVTSTRRGAVTVVVWHGVSRPLKVEITAV